jgi:hypothetical protein
MTKSLTIKKFTVPKETFDKLPPERRSAVLFLGLCVNEASGLRHLLMQATLSYGKFSETVRVQAGLHLVILLGTTLIGKIFEGRNKIQNFDHQTIYGAKDLPSELSAAIENINNKFHEKLDKIRHDISFHYLPLSKFSQSFDDLSLIPDADSIFVSENTVFSSLSYAVTAQRIHRIYGGEDRVESLGSFHHDVYEISMHYVNFCYKAIRYILQNNIQSADTGEEEISFDAPAADEITVHFFMRAPENDILPERIP